VQPETCFGGAYRDKHVLVFGHTGFKGSWLTLWLNELGARVTGVSLDIPTRPSHFEAAAMEGLCDHRTLDIRDRKSVADVIEAVQPDYVFHLAAQSLVRRSYRKPKLTFDTNFGGSLNLLEAIRESSDICALVAG
jgi:CDP-glucose 4,6-dehydratase